MKDNGSLVAIVLLLLIAMIFILGPITVYYYGSKGPYQIIQRRHTTGYAYEDIIDNGNQNSVINNYKSEDKWEIDYIGPHWYSIIYNTKVQKERWGDLEVGDNFIP